MPVGWDEFFTEKKDKRRRVADMSFQCTTCGEVVEDVYDITPDDDTTGMNNFQYICSKDHESSFWLRVPDQLKEFLYDREE
jgi:predicted  nucleic acid-binding Zn-ribbon protein